MMESVNSVEPLTKGHTPEEALPEGIAVPGNLEDLTGAERAAILEVVKASYRRFTDAYEVQDPYQAMALFTDDYELIFPRSRSQSIWNKARVERDVRQCGPQPRGHLRIRVILDNLLSVERDPATGLIREATARATFINEWGSNRAPAARIDTFVLTGTGNNEWKMRRTLALGPQGQEEKAVK